MQSELINRLTILEAQGALSHGKPTSKNISKAIRSLLAALIGLIQAADKNETLNELSISHTEPEVTIIPRVPRRTAVPTDMWQETLSLICHHDYAVRADYTDILVSYLKEEVPKLGEPMGSSLKKRMRKLSEGPLQHSINTGVLLHPGNSGTKFIHAIHGYLYVLATSSSLGLMTSSSTSPSHSTIDEHAQLNVTVIPPAHDEREESSHPPSMVNGRRSFSATQPGLRKSSMIYKRLLDGASPRLSPFTSSSASLGDYTLILNILTAVLEEFPVRGLIAGVPMLLALDHTTRAPDENEATLRRIHAIREVLAKGWLVLGNVWNSSELKRLAETVRRDFVSTAFIFHHRHRLWHLVRTFYQWFRLLILIRTSRFGISSTFYKLHLVLLLHGRV